MGLARFQDIHEQLELTSQMVDEMSAMSQPVNGLLELGVARQ